MKALGVLFCQKTTVLTSTFPWSFRFHSWSSQEFLPLTSSVNADRSQSDSTLLGNLLTASTQLIHSIFHNR